MCIRDSDDAVANLIAEHDAAQTRRALKERVFDRCTLGALLLQVIGGAQTTDAAADDGNTHK